MKLTLLLIVTFLLNLPAGYFRARYKRLSWQWLLILHSPIPLIIFLRYYVLDIGNWWIIATVILTAILSQSVGDRVIRPIIQKKLQKESEN